ncbi:autotransporter outer membrane beta-barrel domain-containing protein [Candidatus Pelagibacter communis]|uniref:autotransporter outer membrane beta-barrel domain-containing protein n=1 Tax=Pelagibacter ubique TaxID=198252 RepID=UPI00094C2B4C|nr:autotransporter outer membrane beta-barrel domain-containing protein [Candidatus Pelagibacter ubique]
MKLFSKALIILIFLFPISNVLANVTHIDDQTFRDGGSGSNFLTGIEFNSNGTKMFTIYSVASGNDNQIDFINEYDLSTPFDISTHTYRGDSERCNLANGYDSGSHQIPKNAGDMSFSSNGMQIFVINRGTNGANDDALYRYDLTEPYDVSTCTLAQEIDPDQTGVEINGWRSGSIDTNSKRHHAQGVAISPDGTKIFISFNGTGSGAASGKSGIREYSLSTPYDISTLTHVDSAGILLPNSTPSSNPDALSLSADGKRIFIVYHGTNGSDAIVEQYSLSSPYDTTDFNLDGALNVNDLVSDKSLTQGRAIAFSAKGFKMFVSDDHNGDASITEAIYEFNLACPFNLFGGTCASIAEDNDRMGMAEAQIELANRTVKLSTNSALNRLKWIRRNKDKQNLSNQNIKLNFSNNLLSSLKELPISSFKKISSSENSNNNNKNYFYWSEGSISLGRVGETSLSSIKKAKTEALTFGFDKFTDDYSLKGFAFRFGDDNVDVGNSGSRLDSNTYNITYYSTSPVQDDTKMIDKIFGIGKIRSNLLTIVDGSRITADRTGNQIYGTVKLKDEFIKGKLTLIPSGQFDFAHTILKGYQESGNAAIIVNDQHVRTRNFRAAIAAVEDLSKKNYSFKRHGKIEYKAELDRSSNFKYTYVEDKSVKFNDTLHTGALHNLNAEVGVDIIFPEHYSIFIIYERNQAFETGHTDNLYVALGYLPHKDTEIAFTINGSENLMSEFEIKKDINGFDLIFNLNDDLTRFGDAREAYIELNKVF